MLIGLDGVDWWSMAAAATLIVLVSLAATWIPTVRAARVEPLKALRME